MKFELCTVLQCAVSVVPMIVLLLMLMILFWRLMNGTLTSDAMCVKVLSRVVAGRGQLLPSPTRLSLWLFPEPDRTQFPQLVLPINSQLTTLRAPEVPYYSLVNSEHTDSVTALCQLWVVFVTDIRRTKRRISVCLLNRMVRNALYSQFFYYVCSVKTNWL
jgi:hypothetical protein